MNDLDKAYIKNGALISITIDANLVRLLNIFYPQLK
jgi:hypothetical protein